MTRVAFRAVTLLLPVVLGDMPLLGQQAPRHYSRVACVQARPGEARGYASLVADARTRTPDSGNSQSEWVELRSVYPGGTDAECEFLSIVAVDDPGAREALNQQSRRELFVSTVNYQLWQQTAATGDMRVGDRVILTFLKVDPAKAQDWIDAETKVYLPMHDERIKRGILHGWSIHRLLFPRGAKEYNAVSIDAFPKLANALGGIPADIVKSFRDSVPGSNDMIQKFVGARQVLRVEVTEVIGASTSQPGR